MAGSQYRILTESLGGFDFVENIETGMVNCRLRVQLRENTLIIESEMDWSNHTEMSPPGYGLSLFYTYNVSNFQIEYDLPFVNNTPPIFIDLDQQVSFNSEDEPTTADTYVCKDIFGNEKNIYQRVDSSRLQNCFNSFKDVDGLYGVGFELEFLDRTGNELFTVSVLCTTIPNSFDDWVSVRYYEQFNEVCQQRNLEKIEDVEYGKIELRLLSCDVRCKMESKADENRSELDLMKPVGDIQSTTENSRFKEIPIDVEKILHSVIVFIALVVVSIVNKFEVIAIVKNKYVKWQNQKSNVSMFEKEDDA